MADLVTHLCTALLPGAFVGRRRLLGPVVLGVVWPDLVARVPPLAIEQLELAGLADVPDRWFFPWGVLHEPVGLLLTCGILAALVVDRDRRGVYAGVLVGCALHLGLDVLQDHEGQGYFLLAPFVLERYELGWIGSEATVPFALPLAAVTAAAWAWRLVKARRSAPRSATIQE